MIDALVGTLGFTNLILLIVGISLMVVVILVMSYFQTLVSIANFTYPNAKFRAHGTPFIKKEVLDPLIEGRNTNELLNQLQSNGYEIPKESWGDIDDIENFLDERTLEYMKETFRASPLSTRPFADAWMNKYDVKMLKKMIKSKAKGVPDEEIRDSVVPVKIVDETLIDEMLNARNIQEVLALLRGTEFSEVIGGQEWTGDFFQLDSELDKFAYGRLKKAVLKVPPEDRSAIKYFFGKYTDILNMKIIFRGLREDVDRDLLKNSLLPSGRELERWKLENMVDSKDIEESLVELEGTSYGGIRKEGVSKDDFQLEKHLDSSLLQITNEMMSQYVLSVGPMLKFMVGKEFELRNIKIIARGLIEGVKPAKMNNMLVMEGEM